MAARVMLGLFVLGGIAIMARYLVFPDSNWPCWSAWAAFSADCSSPPSGAETALCPESAACDLATGCADDPVDNSTLNVPLTP